MKLKVLKVLHLLMPGPRMIYQLRDTVRMQGVNKWHSRCGTQHGEGKTYRLSITHPR